MERKQMIMQHAREFFGERLDQVLQSVRQDRAELRGWQEPARLRAVLRRAVREARPGEGATAPATVAEIGIGRGAGEPDKGEQREALGQILEAGAASLEKMLGSPSPDLTTDEVFGLECVILLYGRPGLLVSEGRMAEGPASWNVLEDQRDDIELTQRAVGRIELVGNPDFDWAGTGFLVNQTCVMTTRSVAQVFTESATGGGWQFRPGITAWMDYQPDYQRPASATYRLKGVLGIHDRYDLALLDVEPPQQNGDSRSAGVGHGAATPTRWTAGLPDWLSEPRRPTQRAGGHRPRLPRRLQRQANPAGNAPRAHAVSRGAYPPA